MFHLQFLISSQAVFYLQDYGLLVNSCKIETDNSNFVSQESQESRDISLIQNYANLTLINYNVFVYRHSCSLLHASSLQMHENMTITFGMITGILYD